jgi:hypothetical protein
LIKFFHKTIFVFVWLLILEITAVQAQNYFRSIASGAWSATATWQMSPDGITWGPAAYAPSYTDNAITIQSPNAVTISANVTIDELTINLGATLITSGAAVLTINDGLSGVDLIVNGTFNESSSSSIAWTASASWQIASNGTLIRTQNTSSNFWQQRYIGGIATIPATANWILRKTAGANPSISTTAGVGGAFYPNLTIENNVAGMWTTATSSTFQGNSAFPTIKGNFDIGGAGTSTLNFLNQHTNGTPTRVLGNVIVRVGNILSNYGTGLEIQGNLTVNGNIQYDLNDLRTIDFSGSAAQTITVGALGACNVWNMRMMKTGNDLTLNSPLKVTNSLTFTAAGNGGRIFTTATNLLTIEDDATSPGASNTSHVNGPVRKLGDEAYIFPVGKNGYYRLCAMGLAAAGAGGTFWTETFTNGCASGCLAQTYTTGPNGPWTISSTGTNGAQPNQWFISCAENGNAAGTCGAGCGSDASLHVGANPNSECTCFSCVDPSGDCGAAYDACASGSGFSFCTGTLANNAAMDKRMESPTINCSGKTNITVAFNYVQAGQPGHDFASLWYSSNNGGSWAALANPLPATNNTGCSGQGRWTAYSIVLPAACDNNPNVKIGFRWQNDADDIGTDPSFAVDDITLGTTPAVDAYTAEYFKNNPQTVYNNILNPPLNHISQCEYWTLVRNVGSSPRTVTLSWDTPNSCGVTSLPDLRIAYFNSASWDDEGNGGTTGNTSAGTIITPAAINTFGPFTLASVTTQNPLPVTLLDFTATAQGNDVLLTWTTTAEINNDRFEILSSNSNATTNIFEEIGQVKGNGNSTSVHRYSYLDERPSKKGTYYYRLKQVDYDGITAYSNIVGVNFKNGNQLTLIGVVPNPYSDKTSIQMFIAEPGLLQERIFDVFGRQISSASYPLDKGMFSFDPEESVRLIPGIYLVELFFNDEKFVTRLVKE